MRSNLFVALEGLSGAGKSTVACLLSKQLGAVLYTTPPRPFSRIRDNVNASCNLTERYFFYLASVIYASSQIVRLLASSAVVCDRYILTTQCYHQVAGVRCIVPTGELGILEPDLTVVVTCAEAERRRRLAQRGLSFNDREEQRLGIDHRMLAAYRKHRIFEVDSTDRPPVEVASQVLQHLKNPSL